MINLKQYQEIAISDVVDGLLPNTLNLLRSSKSKHLIVLKSITGSGKTVIAADYIERLLNTERETDICIIWLSKGNGDLHIQSGEKLERLISTPDIRVHSIRDSSDFNADAFYAKDVYVINWEKMNNKNDKGELVNNLFLVNEKKNITAALRNTRELDFVLIIDEFHLNYNTDSYKKIVEKFNPKVILGMTATPTNKQMAEADRKVVIPVDAVIEAGMIKKGVCFNTVNDFNPDVIKQYNSVDEFFLRLAIEQRDILEKKYRAEGSDITPLLLVQFNDEKSNDEIIAVKEILDKIYADNRNNDYAIWITEDKNSKGLRSSDSIIKNMDTNKVKVLLFKQAIATGWDCPRAHVLLRYRKVATLKDANGVNPFDIQTLGRIFRMPEHKHYNDNDLNYAYVFTPTKEVELEDEFKNAYEDQSNRFTMQRANATPTNTTPTPTMQNSTSKEQPSSPQSEHQTEDNVGSNNDGLSVYAASVKSPKNDFVNERREIENALVGQNKQKINQRPSDDAIKKHIRKLIASTTFSTANNYRGGVQFHGSTMEITEQITDSPNDIQLQKNSTSFNVHDTNYTLSDKAEKLLKKLIEGKKYSKTVRHELKTQINKKFLECIPVQLQDTEEGFGLKAKLILSNEQQIKELISKVDDYINIGSYYDFSPSDFKFPLSAQGVYKEDTKAYLGYIPPLDSGPERIFVKLLDQTDNNVKFWYKCSRSDVGGLCVPYEDVSTNRGRAVAHQEPTYPDFIVVMNDGKVGIYEIKDFDKQEDVNSAKDRAIRDKVDELNALNSGLQFVGKLVYIKQQTESISETTKCPELQIK